MVLVKAVIAFEGEVCANFPRQGSGAFELKCRIEALKPEVRKGDRSLELFARKAQLAQVTPHDFWLLGFRV